MGGGRAAAPSPGWYVDPTGRAELRFWTGQEWTPWVWDGTTVAADQHPVRRALNRSDLEHLEFIDRVFLPEARAGGTLTSGDAAELERLVGELHRVLRPGGLVVYTARTTADAHFGAGTPRGDDMYEHGGFIVHFFDRALIDRLAARFELIDVTDFTEGDLPRRLARVTMRVPQLQ